MTFVGAIAAAAAVIPPDGRAPVLAVAGAGVYLLGLGLAAAIGRTGRPPG
jgi:hypothetical protein